MRHILRTLYLPCQVGNVHFAYNLYEEYRRKLGELTEAELNGQERIDLDAMFKARMEPYNLELAIGKLLHTTQNTIRGKSIHELLRYS